ncbi:M16 family metallopeptidase [Asaia krungthepensis]|uniref:Peptidase n=1 Tax=Asaia krungthepensis NRIC 0535 TaxID=1307925 RepID=A0ABQ0PYW9_9PROT|nr:pitrilysin family protein [Asaia krungthepensis]GBQ85060.1 peptidase [Asaia krungthepensis NRIC 0535]
MPVLPPLRNALLASSLLMAPVLLLNATSGSARAETQAVSSRSGNPSPAATAMSGAVRETLSNGLRVVIVPDRLAPVVQTQVIYLSGSAAAPAGFPGTAHALEHMMFNGSKGLSRDQLSTVSARIGNVSNAFTTEDTTQYYFQAPAHYLDVLLRIEADRMRHVLLSDADWSHERGAIEQEVARDLSMPFERFTIQQNQALFAGTPYEHDALGTRESFDKTDSRLLRGFYDSWYQPNNAILLIVGDVDPTDTLQKVKAQFAAIPAGKLPPRPVITPGPVKPATITLDSDYATGILSIGFRMPGSNSPDMATAQILADVLSSQRGALFALVPQGKALATEFAYNARVQAGVGNALAAFPKGQDPSALLAEIRGILNTIRSKGVPAELVDAAKRKELASLEYNANSVSELTQSWASALAYNGLESPEDLIKAYRAVTPEMVNALAAKVLDPAHAITGILTPSGRKAPDISTGKGPESLLPPPSGTVKLPDWAASALADLPAPQKLTQPTVYTLSNGITLLVQPEHVSHTVVLYGSIRHNNDLQQPKGKEGVAGLTSDLFLYGSKTHDRLAMATALDALASDANAGLSFSLNALTPQFDKTLSLLAEMELHPAFPIEAFSILKQQAIATQAGVLQSPGYRFQRALTKALAPANDPTLRETTPQSLSSLTLRDVQDFYNAAYRPDLTTIVVIGDITPEKAKSSVEAAFSGWTAHGAKPVVDLPPRPQNKPSQAVVDDPGRVQDSVYLAQTIASGIHNPDRYALEVGNEILGSGFSSRLMQDLRVRTGMVYTAGSDLGWSANRGAFLITYGSDPDKTTKARDAAVHNVTAMQSAPVSDDELLNAKASILRAIPMDRASFGGIAGQYLSLADLGLPLSEPDDRASAVYRMSARQVQDAFHHWIRPQDMVQIIRGPAPR